MTSAERTSIDTDTGLRELVRRGFQFVHPTDADGELTAVVGVRAHHGVIDVVRLHDESDVHAVRMPGDEDDVMAPQHVLWERSGRVGDVLAALIDLSDHAARPLDAAPAKGCWVPVRSGDAKWVPASA